MPESNERGQALVLPPDTSPEMFASELKKFLAQYEYTPRKINQIGGGYELSDEDVSELEYGRAIYVVNQEPQYLYTRYLFVRRASPRNIL